MALQGSPPGGLSHHHRSRHTSLVGNEPQFEHQHPIPALPSPFNQPVPAQQTTLNTSPSAPVPSNPDPFAGLSTAKLPQSIVPDHKMPKPTGPKIEKGAIVAPSSIIRDALSGRCANSPQFLLDIATFSLADSRETLIALESAHSVLNAKRVVAKTVCERFSAAGVPGGSGREVAAAEVRYEKLGREVEGCRMKMEVCGREIASFRTDIAYLEQYIAKESGARGRGGIAGVGDLERVEKKQGKLRRYKMEGEGLGERFEGVGIAM